MRKTKIVVTLGPKTSQYESVCELIDAGVNVFRLNFSHSTHEEHFKTIQTIRKAQEDKKATIAILQDIAGPKIRIGMIEGSFRVEKGCKYFMDDSSQMRDDIIPFPHPQIIKDITKGTKIFFADGTIRARVSSVVGQKIELDIEVGGELTSKKGVNFPDLKFSIPTLTKKDIADIKFGIEAGVDIVAISFVRDKNDILQAKALAKAYGGDDVLVFPKIEKKEAVDNLDEILSVSDGVMVARGDLGVELGVENVPVIQKRILQKANNLGIPSITATQMLTSMINSPYPTRAEVSDIANAALDGTDAVMLSDETAIGAYPVLAVEMLSSVLLKVQEIYPYNKNAIEEGVEDAIWASVAKLSSSINPDAIVVFTISGRSAKKLSKFRIKSDIIASTFDKKAAQTMGILWGVQVLSVKEYVKNSDELIEFFIIDGLNRGILKREGRYIFVMGYPIGESGVSNLIRIVDREYFEKIGY